MEPIEAANGLSFRVGFSGHSGHLRLEPLSTVERANPVNSVPDFILPPAFIEETQESIKAYIEEKYLRPNLDAEEFSPEKAGRDWEFDWFDKAKVPLEPSLPRSVVVPVWELPFRRQAKLSGSQIWEPDSLEVDISKLTSGVQDSGSLPRITGPPKDFMRGSISNRPFRPGGLDDSQSFERTLPDGALNGEWARELLNGGSAQSVPPSFKQGLHLGDLKAHPCSWTVYKEQGSAKRLPDEREKMVELSVQFDDLFKKAWEDDTTADYEEEAHLSDHEPTVPEAETDEIDAQGQMRSLGVPLLDEILSDELGGTAVKSGEKNPNDGRQQEVWAITAEDGIADHFHELVPDMALEFPFELDKFQKEAIYCLERGDSVFVSAHTSAGKTVVAEYAFALASKHCTRAIYTAPIKTISNQKYRDFCGKFDVGLLTGDISLRPEASCLIMTTEILRSMLYRGADIIRDIEWVIFDEVHYVNDAERGVVWEEVIIMLPRHVNIILLSATVPNTMEFADWIGRTKQKKIRVTGTTKRPVPLEHCLFYSGELYRICESEIFIQQGLRAARDAFKKKNAPPGGAGNGPKAGPSPVRGGGQGEKCENFSRGKLNKHSGAHNLGKSSGNGAGNQGNGNGDNNWGLRRSEASLWLQLINKLSKKSLLPVVVFCFSKNRCDRSADSLTGTDLTSSSEKSEIRVFCDKAFSRLKGSDRNLPQIVRIQSLLRRGIGVHHAGLLPIVKEVIEMLFCRGVIKVLFSTETFAMGVNAPARTVVFDSLRKFDGKDFRELLPGEYTQMAGRAGRRGLDKFGTVIVMCRDEIPEESNLRHVIVGSATKLESQFRLTYIMILHLLRVEELKVEDMLKRSFAEFHAQKGLSETHTLLKTMLDQPTKSIECIKGEPAIKEYYEMHEEAERLNNDIADSVMQSPVAAHFLTPGRVVVVKCQSGQDHFLGVVIEAEAGKRQYIVLTLRPDLAPTVQSSPGSGNLQDVKVSEFQQGSFLLPKSKRRIEEEYDSAFTSRKRSGAIRIQLPHHGAASGMSYEVRRVETREFLFMCSKRIQVNQVGLLEDDSAAAYSKTVQQLLDLKSGRSKYPPALDPVKDLKLKDVELVNKYRQRDTLLRKMTENKCHGCIKLAEHMKLAEEIRKHKEKVAELKFQMSDEALQQMPEFQGRVEVLKKIGCIDADLVVQLKGRVACEMNSGEELICTECLFDNQLDCLEPEEAVALMSAFVFQQRNTSEPTLTPKLLEARQRLHETAIRLGQLQVELGLPISPEEYAQENLKFGLVEVVYEWAKGTPFADICKLTDVPEGLIVRTIVRLDETCREFKNAASIMGNSALHKKMEAASNAIKRDIVFAASLYITGV
ncbi:DExH-box ATP-dependent RNA helicase DExH11 isoform X2 [Punica granatum]|uniref:DExH-box ATP-dependent RNA helicase DExH11 isoform X2 n=1 Tax=Punica granatum TaxID=22663 RepID=A0A6P8CQR6_PUNGR|nr:DExH-box ATP-dependent RNA helicase DExH11 isoform X2 [Punica granatum]